MYPRNGTGVRISPPALKDAYSNFKHIPVKNRPLKCILIIFLLSLLECSSNKQKVVSTALYVTEQAVKPRCQNTRRLHYVKVYGVCQMSPLETNIRLVKTFLSRSVGLSTYSKRHKRSVAQSGRASDLGSEGRRFESFYSDYLLLVMMERLV